MTAIPASMARLRPTLSPEGIVQRIPFILPYLQTENLTERSGNQTPRQQSEHHDSVQKVPLGGLAAHQIQLSRQGVSKLEGGGRPEKFEIHAQEILL